LAFEIKQQWRLNKRVVILLVLSATGPSLRCLTKASIYHRTYCPRSRKWPCWTPVPSRECSSVWTVLTWWRG
jgi:hypothetical protein